MPRLKKTGCTESAGLTQTQVPAGYNHPFLSASLCMAEAHLECPTDLRNTHYRSLHTHQHAVMGPAQDHLRGIRDTEKHKENV